MKIAVPTVGNQIDQHFGHCEKYSVVTINGKIVLAENGVKILIAGGIGNGAVKMSWQVTE